jgi:phosphoribosylformylglycinamidine synthase subunit PurL
MIGRTTDDIGSSEYLEFFHEITDSPLPEFNIDNEIKIQGAIKKLNELKLLKAPVRLEKEDYFLHSACCNS